MCGPYPRRRRYYQIREFQMASSADELESEDPDDELELDDSEPPTRAEDCSVVNFQDKRTLIDSTLYHCSAQATVRH